ncbi:MAG TPA: hypothetical protein VFW37_04580 [Alphaproteobacteria bacterium]|nr:hypothetical protein [Alphaproteobacteria bacterium]
MAAWLARCLSRPANLAARATKRPALRAWQKFGGGLICVNRLDLGDAAFEWRLREL